MRTPKLLCLVPFLFLLGCSAGNELEQTFDCARGKCDHISDSSLSCCGPYDNFCDNPPQTAGCAMTFPGGYCDPDGDGSFADADWDFGYYDHAGVCPAECPCVAFVENFCNLPAATPGCAMTFPGGYCDPNGDASYVDADWDLGYYDYLASCDANEDGLCYRRRHQRRGGVVEADFMQILDSEGRLIESGYDSNLDGVREWTMNYTYTADLLTRIVASAEDSVAWTEERFYDDTNRLTHRETDEPGGDVSIRHVYGQFSDQLIARHWVAAGGFIFRFDQLTWSTDGLRVEALSDMDGDGVSAAVRSTVFTFDTGGRLLSMALDTNRDGALEQLKEFAYSQQGNHLRTTTTFGFNTATIRNQVEHFVDGDLVRRTFDDDGDGAPDRENTFDSDVSCVHHADAPQIWNLDW